MKYEEVIDKLKTIAAAHYNVAQVDAGVLEHVVYKTNQYPLVFFITNLAEITETSIRYQIIMLVADKSNIEVSQQIEVQSDAFEITKDIVAYLLNGDYTSPWYAIENVVSEPFVDNLGDILSGWSTTLNITVKFNSNGCELPFDPNKL
mgnify:CR=1 FL=1